MCTVDTDYAKVSLSLSARRISMNYAIINTSLSSPHIDLIGTVLCGSMTSTNGIICDSSIQCDSINVGDTSMQSIGENHCIDVLNPNAYIYFNIASLTSRN